MCDKVVDDSLPTLKLIPDWSITSKMVKDLFIALNEDQSIFYFNEDFDNVVLSKILAMKWVFLI